MVMQLLRFFPCQPLLLDRSVLNKRAGLPGGSMLRVTATAEIIDDGAVFALAGDIGEVIDLERYTDGVIAATVKFPGAPRVTTTYVDQDCVITDPEPDPRGR